jgi:hypothetical protein
MSDNELNIIGFISGKVLVEEPIAEEQEKDIATNI